MEAGINSAATLEIGPPPQLADVSRYVRPAYAKTSIGVQSLRFWLVDAQTDLLGEKPVFFYRLVREVLTTEGLGGVRDFQVDYDPAFQRVVVHHVRIQRAEEVRELASLDVLEVFRRERDLERARYDGHLTVHMFLPDVRVGDIVDVSYSIVGDHPLLGSAYSQKLRFQWDTPVVFVRYRIASEARREFDCHYSGLHPDFEETPLADGGLLRTWTASDFPPFQYEPDTPSWWVGHSEVLVAERTSWADVADVFRPNYAIADALPPDLLEAVEKIARESQSPSGRAACALKFVQASLHYLSVGIGDGGFVPRPLDRIWASRFADCKDASSLLVAVLRRLGLKADPALVNTASGWMLDELPPRLTAFDHCVVRAELDGQPYWLDPTRPPQGGRLGKVDQARYGWALPLRAGSKLEAMEEGPVETVFEQRRRITFGRGWRSPAGLEVRTVYRAWQADHLRRQLANEGEEAFGKGSESYFTGQYGELVATAPASVKDRDQDNEIEVVEHFELKRPWKFSGDGRIVQFKTVSEAFSTVFSTPSSVPTMPKALGAPRRVLHAITLSLPTAWSARGWTERWDVGAVDLRSSASVNAGGLEIDFSTAFEIRERMIPAEAAGELQNALAKARGRASVVLTRELWNHAVASSPVVSKLRPEYALRQAISVIIFALIALGLLLFWILEHASQSNPLP
jgi:transglutaminase-like putative cysteine protease